MARRRGSGVRAAVAAAAVLPLAVLPSAAATAPELHRWTYDVRPAGMPATDVAARTLVSAGADHLVAWAGHLDATVVLGAEPTTDTDGDLHLVLGTLADGTCTPARELTTPTFAPVDGWTRDGATLTASGDLGRYEGASWDCSYVRVTAPGDTVTTDRLDGRAETWAVDLLARVDVRRVTHRRLPRERWSFVRVRLANVGADVTRVRVTGRGRGLGVGRAVVRVPFAAGTTRTVEVPVRLEARHARRLTLATHPRGHDITWTVVDRARVVVRPRRS